MLKCIPCPNDHLLFLNYLFLHGHDVGLMAAGLVDWTQFSPVNLLKIIHLKNYVV